ncbi:MAG: hypothetical protein R2749_16115 [Acidimicrobiales bacterium]
MYLQYLADPTKLVDQASVKKLESDVDKAKDPIDKLKAVAALERARAVDGQQHEDAFIRNARAWADAEGIPLAAFKTMGVPDAVLARAGFDDGRRRGGRSRSAAKRATTRSGRAKSTSADAIREWVLATAGTFTLADVQKGIGGSPATIKKAIDELIEADKVENLGAAAEHHGRGRARITTPSSAETDCSVKRRAGWCSTRPVGIFSLANRPRRQRPPAHAAHHPSAGTRSR